MNLSKLLKLGKKGPSYFNAWLILLIKKKKHNDLLADPNKELNETTMSPKFYKIDTTQK